MFITITASNGESAKQITLRKCQTSSSSTTSNFLSTFLKSGQFWGILKHLVYRQKFKERLRTPVVMVIANASYLLISIFSLLQGNAGMKSLAMKKE